MSSGAVSPLALLHMYLSIDNHAVLQAELRVRRIKVRPAGVLCESSFFRPRHGQAATTNALFCRPQFTDSHGWRGFCKLAAVSLVYSVDFGRAVRCCERDLLHDQRSHVESDFCIVRYTCVGIAGVCDGPRCNLTRWAQGVDHGRVRYNGQPVRHFVLHRSNPLQTGTL